MIKDKDTQATLQSLFFFFCMKTSLTKSVIRMRKQLLRQLWNQW